MSKPTKSTVVFGVGPRQGVGAELCFRAAKEGLHTFVNGRSEDKVLAIVDAIRAEGGSADPLVADVTDPAAVAQAVATIEQSGLPLELAIYNAGNNRPEAFLDVSPEIFEDMWRVLTMGAFLVSQQVIPLMRA